MELLAALGRPHAFASPDYLELFTRQGERAACAVYRSDGAVVLYPFILRRLSAPPFADVHGEPHLDMVSPPFGWGGPLVVAGSPELSDFYRRLEVWARDCGVVSEYVTFPPTAPPPAAYPGEVTRKMDSVVRSLAESPETIWLDYKDTVRRCIRRAERDGVRIEIDPDGRRADEFLSVYAATMDRRTAGDDYQLSSDFLRRLDAGLRGAFAYFHAMLGGRLVSTELVLLAGTVTLFFRGGTLAEAFPARPNHLLKHHVILWSRERGQAHYVLGGGNRDDDDLLRFKLTFAPSGARPLNVGRWVIDPAAYDRLVKARERYETERHGALWRPSPSYFPRYRAPALAAEHTA
jgi:hypothetical protein